MAMIQKFKNIVEGSRVVDVLQKAIDRTTDIKNSVQGWAGSLYEVASNSSPFIGLDYNQVPNIREAIRSYVAGIQEKADTINTAADSNKAVHGEAAEAVKQYLQSIKTVTDAYVSNLLAYSDKMQEYYEAYKASDTSLSSDITQEATSLSSSVEAYTEKK